MFYGQSSMDMVVQAQYCIGCNNLDAGASLTLPCCQGRLCLTCFNQLRMECAFNVTDSRMYTCPVCRRAGSSCRLFSVTPNALTRPGPMMFTEIVRELALLVPRSSSRSRSNKHTTKQPPEMISASTSTTSTATPITNVSYPPSALRLDDCEGVTLKPSRMRLGKKTGMLLLLPGYVFLRRNKVEFLHKEYSDVAGLVV